MVNAVRTNLTCSSLSLLSLLFRRVVGSDAPPLVETRHALKRVGFGFGFGFGFRFGFGFGLGLGGAEVRRCRGAEVQRCGGAEVQWVWRVLVDSE